MQIVCLDLEGVLVPEVWIEFSKRTNIPELSRTTRDEPDYDKLMRSRIALLAQHKLGLRDIQDVIAKMQPLEGARSARDGGRRSRPRAVGAAPRMAHAGAPGARGRGRRARAALRAGRCGDRLTLSARRALQGRLI